MMMSPLASVGTKLSIVSSTGAPAGTMIQTMRGPFSFATTSLRSLAGVAPSF